MAALQQVFKKIKKDQVEKPHIIFAKTVKGKGISTMEGKFEAHYKSLSKEQKENILKEL